MRGTLSPRSVCPFRERFIPAHAGNISEIDRQTSNETVHPRACGEHSVSEVNKISMTGSSPRMRGTYRTPPDLQSLLRFIPAHAGNIVPIKLSVSGTTVHPRACGEHKPSIKTPPHSVGSSPRMRGTYNLAGLDSANTRFIPAHAGNIPAVLCPSAAATVHPRACGEHLFDKDSLGRSDGSSPRMRGTYSCKGR